MDDPIPISALQHFAFCPRQCAYIHIERVWQDNYLTAKGNQLHERVHGGEAETRGDLRSERGVQVRSEKLGIIGKLDLLEIKQKPLRFIPVEYKRGKPKTDNCDRVQLCAQALCLEEMRGIVIERAALWYWQVRKRDWIDINETLREQTRTIIESTRNLLESCRLPEPKYSKSCKACSFFDDCGPRQTDHSRHYVNRLFSP